MSNHAAARAEAIVRHEEVDRRIRDAAALSASVLARPYAPGKWTALQVLNHIADTDAVLLYRFLYVIAEPGKTLVPFDQDVWATALASESRPAALAQQISSAARAAFLYYLRELPDAALLRTSLHPERGPMSALRIAQMSSGHALHHLEQLDAVVAGHSWQAHPASY